ncbi:MAG: hypothetical protein ACOYT8_00855 [Candidatus Dependentiae bacterium]
MEMVPPLSFLLVFLIIFLVFIRKIESNQLAELLSSKNILIFSSLFLFIVVLVFHLFSRENWTADLLKVIVGILIGLSSTISTNKKETENESSANVNGSNFGDNTKIAGRDINEIIEEMYNEVGEIKDSVINQYSNTSKIVGKQSDLFDQVAEYLFYTSFLIDGEPIENSAKIIQELQLDNWSLFSVASSYINKDGIVLVFNRIREPKNDDELIPGTKKYKTRIYHGIEQRKIR